MTRLKVAAVLAGVCGLLTALPAAAQFQKPEDAVKYLSTNGFTKVIFKTDTGKKAISWTDRGLLAVKVKARTDFTDPKREGLVLRVTPNGSKTWALVYRRKSDGKRLGGYGIHLIKHLMDKLIYNARGNRVVAIKYLDKVAV